MKQAHNPPLDAQEEFLRRNTGWCRVLHLRMSRENCEAIKSRVPNGYGSDGPPPQCAECAGLDMSAQYENPKAKQMREMPYITAKELFDALKIPNGSRTMLCDSLRQGKYLTGNNGAKIRGELERRGIPIEKVIVPGRRYYSGVRLAEEMARSPEARSIDSLLREIAARVPGAVVTISLPG